MDLIHNLHPLHSQLLSFFYCCKCPHCHLFNAPLIWIFKTFLLPPSSVCIFSIWKLIRKKYLLDLLQIWDLMAKKLVHAHTLDCTIYDICGWLPLFILTVGVDLKLEYVLDTHCVFIGLMNIRWKVHRTVVVWKAFFCLRKQKDE